MAEETIDASAYAKLESELFLTNLGFNDLKKDNDRLIEQNAYFKDELSRVKARVGELSAENFNLRQGVKL